MTKLNFPQDLPLTALDRAFASFLQQLEPSDDPRHGWLAALVSHQFGRGHACLDLAVLADHGVAALGWESELQTQLPVELAAAVTQLPWRYGPASPLVLDENRLYLRRNWQAEQSIRAAIEQRLKQSYPVSPALAQTLNLLFHAPGCAANTNALLTSAWPDSVAPAVSSGAALADPPNWQMVACALAARSAITLITGGPGTGKTSTVVRLLALLQWQALQVPATQSARQMPVPTNPAQTQALRIALAAPTGKAAARLGQAIANAQQELPLALRQQIPTQAQTLHRLLGMRASSMARALTPLALDLLVIDEASMIDLELMARLLDALPAQARLILLGDQDQLASVEAGAVLGQLCSGAHCGGYSPQTVSWIGTHSAQDVSRWCRPGSTLAQQTVLLRHSFRFASDSSIGLWASAVNSGDVARVTRLWHSTPKWCPSQSAGVTCLLPERNTDAELTTLMRTGWRDWLTQLTALTSAACSDAQALALLQAFGRFQLLCALRDGPWGVQTFNSLAAQALNFPLHGWYAGRPVMLTCNDYHLQLMNGDVGLCLPTSQGLRVAFIDLRADAPACHGASASVRWVRPSRLGAVETVFAMTVHKAQGSEFDQIALVLPEHVTALLTRELLYTGISRAKNQLTLVLPQVTLLAQVVARKILRSGGLIF